MTDEALLVRAVVLGATAVALIGGGTALLVRWVHAACGICWRRSCPGGHDLELLAEMLARRPLAVPTRPGHEIVVDGARGDDGARVDDGTPVDDGARVVVGARDGDGPFDVDGALGHDHDHEPGPDDGPERRTGEDGPATASRSAPP